MYAMGSSRSNEMGTIADSSAVLLNSSPSSINTDSPMKGLDRIGDSFPKDGLANEADDNLLYVGEKTPTSTYATTRDIQNIVMRNQHTATDTDPSPASKTEIPDASVPHTAITKAKIIVTTTPRFPSPDFFASEKTNHAKLWMAEVGSDDINLSIVSTPRAHGSAFVYKTSPKAVRKVLRAFLYGQIVAIDNLSADTIQGIPTTTKIQRVSIQRASSSTDMADSYFANSVREAGAGSGTLKHGLWTIYLTALRTDESTLTAEHQPFLHRQDSYPADSNRVNQPLEGKLTAAKAYCLCAHSAECVDRDFLQAKGWIGSEVGALPVDEAIALVQKEMEKMQT
ncbi:hypothetical protein C8R43DRAFT_947432 [Mycena crocata]|nr:hypothetical protein C8R43DRAFT_947432 [Mycena crocata]